MATYTYTINNSDFTIEVFQDGDTVPFVRQPHDLLGNEWKSKEQAEAWVKDLISELKKPLPPETE